MKKRNIYLDNMLLKDALENWQKLLDKTVNADSETIDIIDSVGRISCVAIFATNSSPHYNASAMDGIAVKAEDTFEASEKNPVSLKEGSDFIYVNTGEIIPPEYDSVIMIEDVIIENNGVIKIINSAVPWQHIRPIGEDIVSNELIIPSMHKIRPVDIGAMLAGGIRKIKVYKKPVIGIIPTGNEIIEPREKTEKGKIVEYNSRVFSGMIDEWGGIPKRYDIVPDNMDLIKEKVNLALTECDALIINAGSSAGSRDFTKDVIKELGDVLVHGVAIKPGKPVILGNIKDKPIVGIPGYPVSAYFDMNFFVKPMINRFIGYKNIEAHKIDAKLAKKIVSSLKHDEFIRVKLGNVNDKIIASPLSRGAGVIMSLVRADGYITVPKNSEGFEAGQTVKVNLMKDINKILKTLVIIGSNDPVIDLIAEMMHRSNLGYYVSSTHVGSLGGIMALMRDEAHMAGVHLLDPTDGSYNKNYMKRYVKNKMMALIHLMGRQQGLMVQKNNPKNIKGFEDLTRKDVVFINRQRGSGTRLLLDYYITEKNIQAKDINGYTREEFTHLTTAASVFEGSADTALGIYSAAKAVGLDFIPVCTEQYDMAIPVNFLEMDIVKKFMDIINSNEFKQRVKDLGGYDLSITGNIEYI